MELTLEGYDQKLTNDFEHLPFEKLLFFGTWVCEYMNNKYGGYLNELGYEAEHQTLSDAITFLWSIVDKGPAVKDAAIKAELKKVELTDIGELDFAETRDCGVLKVLEGVETMLNFSRNKSLEYIVACGMYPLDVLEVILANEYEIDASDADHPLLKEEFEAQTKLIDHLKNNSVTSADKHIFR